MTEESHALFVRDLCDALGDSRLPLDREGCELAAEAIAESYDDGKKARSIDDAATYFDDAWSYWLSGGVATNGLKRMVKLALLTKPELTLLADNYFNCVDKLEKNCFLTRSAAVSILENASIIYKLRVEEHYSYDRIASVIGFENESYDVVKTVSVSMGSDSALQPSDVKRILKDDAAFADTFYGYSDDQQSIKALESTLDRLGLNSKIAKSVNTLFNLNIASYLCVLHYELLTIEMYDRRPGHAVYEFAPRGDALKDLWKTVYPEAETKEPYLNIAKSVYSLDRDWAKTKVGGKDKGTIQNAPYELVSIFEALSTMPYPTRRHVAQLIRSLLLRRQAIKTARPTPLPAPCLDEIKSFLAFVETANTRTKGHFEQRAVDFATFCLEAGNGVVVSGIGSSVNETNLSSKKFGDVEYLDEESRTIHSYEPHGGSLSDVYIDDHLGTLERISGERADTLTDTYGPGTWDVTVTFVAHDVKKLKRYGNNEEIAVGTFNVSIRVVTFAELFSPLSLDNNGAIDVFKSTVHSKFSCLSNGSSLRQRYEQALGRTHASPTMPGDERGN